MRRLILDTNILLDIFVFQDIKTQDLKQAIINRQITVFASQKTIAELADVITRPLFGLEPQQQNKILEQWQSLSQLQDDSSLPQAPWTCADLISKDNALLTLASRAAKEDILITANYDSFKIQA
ncbi:MAG: hypothetical protein B7X60_16575 [Polynucleobacter sp. 39-45-136]|nr:MAG: hypothetical protein B7X60_16575 [Polynucleobacter sp. 39-45-136]